MEHLFKQRKDKLSVFKKRKKTDLQIIPNNIPVDLYTKCPHCEMLLLVHELADHHYVCEKCQGPLRISAKQRIEQICDGNTFKVMFQSMKKINPLDFPQYEEKINQNRSKTKLDEAIVCGVGKIDQQSCAIAIMDPNFMMGSMGLQLGEKLTTLIEYATKKRYPLVVFCASGGARMQEGIFSLMQMAKTSAALKKHEEAGLLYVSVLTHPTYGGVSASFAMLGDIILAEPMADIGFAGKRVIEQTIQQTLPEGFQSAEYLLSAGFIDEIVERKKMKATISKIVNLHVR